MNGNKVLIEKFYTCLQQSDSDGMLSCYSNDIVYYDPMYDLLRGHEVISMWELFLKSTKNFTLEYSNITDLGDNYYTCDWTASYIYSDTGKRVADIGKAHMKTENGFITEHSDARSLHKWSEQAIGITGKLFGWAGFFRRRIKNDARRALLKYTMEQSK